MELIEFSSHVLQEGLIKVPPEMLRKLLERIYSEYISYMALAKGGELLDDARKLSSTYGAKIDPGFKPRNVFTPIDGIDGIPDKYLKAWHYEFGRLDFVIDWEQKIWGSRPKVNASFEEGKGYFTVNPLKWAELIDGNEYSLKKATSILEKVRYSMWHESSHAVQHNALKWLDQNQVQKSREVRDDPNSTPEQRRAEYLQSMVEFDPTLKTSIFKFKKVAAKASSDKELRIALAKFVGAVQADDLKPNDFFMAVKVQDLKKWKRAVKYFYKYHGFDPAQILGD